MGNIKTVFLDCDGLVLNFIGSLCKLMSLDINNHEVRKALKQPEGLYTLVPKKEMWKTVGKAGEEFWANLELYPWSYDLCELCNNLTNGNTYFLTAPSTDPFSLSGKVRSIKRHFNTDKFIITKHKHLLAGVDKLLVDDRTKFTNRFIENGGQAILWPNDLALLDGDISLTDVFEKLKNMIVGDAQKE